MKWDGEYIYPYVEHGQKSERVKKITVSIPTRVLKVLTDERTRRQVKNLRHATNSELLCEAFLHAFTGQPVDIRRLIALRAETTHVRVAHVIHEDDDDVRLLGRKRRLNKKEKRQDGEMQKAHFPTTMPA